MSANDPPIREPWKTDKTGKLVSLPWILWLRQLSSSTQVTRLLSDTMLFVTPADVSVQETGFVGTSAAFDDAASFMATGYNPSSTTVSPDDVASLEAMAYTPSSNTVPSNDPEMLAWLSF